MIPRTRMACDMTRRTTVIGLLLIVGLVAATGAATADTGGVAVADVDEQNETTTPRADENATVRPGEKMTGAVSVQEAELGGEVDERTYGIAVARANTDDAKADVVAAQLGTVEQRLDELEERTQALEEARENGEITEGRYRAEIARVAVETENAKRLANASERTAGELPADLLAEKGINVTAIRTLKDRAEELSGPEVAEIARSIAGEQVGASIAGEQTPDEVADQIPDDAGQGAGDNQSDGDGQRGDNRQSEEDDEETATSEDGSDQQGSDRGGNSSR